MQRSRLHDRIGSDWRNDPLRAAADNAAAAIGIIDADLRYIYANEALAELNGVALADTIGRTVREVLPHEADEIEAMARRVLDTGETVNIHAAYLAALVGDSTRQWSATYYPIFHGGRVVGVVGMVVDASERLQHQARQRFVAEAGAVLAASLDYGETLQTLATLAVPFLADMCIVDLVTAAGTIQRVAVAHADPAAEKLAHTLREQGARDIVFGHPIADVIASGQPLLLPEVSGEVTARVARGERHLGILHKLRFRSAICVPLIARGKTLGAISFVVTNTDRTYSEGDLSLAEEFARRAAAAADNARLYEGERSARKIAERAQHWTARLQTATAALAAAATPEEVTASILNQCATALDAQRGFVAMVTDDGTATTIAVSVGFSAGHFDPWPRISLARRTPLSEAMATRMPVWCASRADALQRFPDIEASRNITDKGAWVSLPLTYGEQALGGVGLILREEREAKAEEIAFLGALGPLCGQALERARLYEAEQKARFEAERLRQVAEAANLAKTQFLTSMSHELRTPLNAIGGYAELLSMGIRGPTTSEQQEDFRRITRSQRHLLSVINDILNFARLDADRVQYDIRTVSLSSVVYEIEPLVAPQLRAKGIKFSIHLGDADARILADPEKVRQILINVVANAVKFTPQGGQVTIRSDSNERVACIHIRDTGIGVASDRLEAIFEPFVQVHRTLTEPTEGTGLGLAISRELARGMGGDLSVVSEAGAGSTFTVVLPIA